MVSLFGHLCAYGKLNYDDDDDDDNDDDDSCFTGTFVHMGG